VDLTKAGVLSVIGEDIAVMALGRTLDHNAWNTSRRGWLCKLLLSELEVIQVS